MTKDDFCKYWERIIDLKLLLDQWSKITLKLLIHQPFPTAETCLWKNKWSFIALRKAKAFPHGFIQPIKTWLATSAANRLLSIIDLLAHWINRSQWEMGIDALISSLYFVCIDNSWTACDRTPRLSHHCLSENHVSLEYILDIPIQIYAVLTYCHTVSMIRLDPKGI